MRAATLATIAALTALSVACGSNPAGPSTSAQATAGLRIVADPVVTLTSGESATLLVEETDAAGRVIMESPARYTWTSSEPLLVSVGGAGAITAGAGYGQAIVTARSASGLTATARIWVQPPPEVPSTYRITLLFAPDMAPVWRKDLEDAARRWEQVIRLELPEAPLYQPSGLCGPVEGEPDPPPLTGTERGTRIYVGYSGQYVAGTTNTAAGGPCLQRPLPRATTVYGQIWIRRGASGVPPERRRFVALHEMGHTLGLVGMVQGRQPDWLGLNVYRGPMGLEGYRRQSGVSTDAITTGGGHWTFGAGVMGGCGCMIITDASIGALMDLGYPTGWYAAGNGG